jgi:branched-chain amino acid transport system permease protein
VELPFGQFLNGLAYGMLLFILAAGLSLIFGLMNVVVLIDGSFFMLGAFIGFSIQQAIGSFWLALTPPSRESARDGGRAGVQARPLSRGHLDQMLMTFSPLFISATAVKWMWTDHLKSMSLPADLDTMVNIAVTAVEPRERAGWNGW